MGNIGEELNIMNHAMISSHMKSFLLNSHDEQPQRSFAIGANSHGEQQAKTDFLKRDIARSSVFLGCAVDPGNSIQCTKCTASNVTGKSLFMGKTWAFESFGMGKSATNGVLV